MKRAGSTTPALKLLVLAVLLLTVTTPAAAADRCAGDRLPLLPAATEGSPHVNLAADGVSGAFLLDYGSTFSSLSESVFPNAATGRTVDVSGFTLPSFDGGRFRLASIGGAKLGASRKVGVVGTDFLSLLNADFVFDAAGDDVVLSSEPCDRDSLLRRGLVPIRQTGFFSSDVAQVRPDRANVPVLPLRIGRMTVPAQIDSGYDDGVLPPSVDINDALFRALDKQGVLQAAGRITLTTCHGNEVRDVFRAPDLTIAIVDDGGRAVHVLENVRLIRKVRNACGGIAGQDEPAAQLGVSILRQLGVVVFDPKSELVWVPGRPASQ